MKRYLIVIEQTNTGFSAYSPDLEGCVATGTTRKRVEERMREAIEFHLEGMKEEGHQIPEPHTESSYVEVAV
jgi:predicted RNase H-like HicB family nuclease